MIVQKPNGFSDYLDSTIYQREKLWLYHLGFWIIMTSSLLLCLLINSNILYKRRQWVNLKTQRTKTTGHQFRIMPTMFPYRYMR